MNEAENVPSLCLRPERRIAARQLGVVATLVLTALATAPPPAANAQTSGASRLQESYCQDTLKYCESRVSEACLTPGSDADPAACDELWIDYENCVVNVDKICEAASAVEAELPDASETKRTAGQAAGLGEGLYCPEGETRVALVIGNSNYAAVSTLKNPANDAAVMARTLRDLCFTVIERRDLDQIGIQRAIAEFGDAMQGAQGTLVSLLFYAGHGVQVDGANYMIPVNAELDDETDVPIWGVPIDRALDQMSRAGSDVNIVFLDACRDNPFTERRTRSTGGATRGLARMNAPRGTMIGFATGPGEVADDGVGDNSPFTAALSKAIVKPDTLIEAAMNEVREAVFRTTEEVQVPWTSSSIIGKFYFVRRR